MYPCCEKRPRVPRGRSAEDLQQSENELRRQLQDAWSNIVGGQAEGRSAGGLRRQAASACRNAGTRIGGQRRSCGHVVQGCSYRRDVLVVEHVESFRDQLQIEAFSESNVARDARIK